MKHTKCPYPDLYRDSDSYFNAAPVSYSYQTAWELGYRQALLDVAAELMDVGSLQSVLTESQAVLRCAQLISDAALRLDPHTKASGGKL